MTASTILHTPAERLSAIREQMEALRLSAYLVPSSDPHQSEYVADHWSARQWLTGFTGSAGLAVVLSDAAFLWADSRYFLQAAEELSGTGFSLKKQSIDPGHAEWLSDNLPEGARVGLDASLFSRSQERRLRRQLEQQGLEVVDADLIEPIWNDRPPLPAHIAFEHDVELAGASRAEKLAQVRERMRGAGTSHLLIAALDELAWLLNLRGHDVAYNPVFIGYLLLDETGGQLFTLEGKIDEALAATLAKDGIHVRPYRAVYPVLEQLDETARLWIDPASVNIRLADAADGATVYEQSSPVQVLKAIKNEREIEQIKHTMVRDGVALVGFYRWLEKEIELRPVPEAEIAAKIAECRAQQDRYYGESFSAIVGFRGNGAIVHYRPEPGHCAEVEGEGMLLIDSGGQYLDGTTDITRTVFLGTPSDEQKLHYTLVLKGHIALATARFPEGTTGVQLDTLARLPLWKDCLDYGHGTGHGVGFFLNVHEPPQGFAATLASSRATTPLKPGMLSSNEPGYYLDGEYGIRIENLVLCVPFGREQYKSEDIAREFYQFETLTLFPIATDLILRSILTVAERDWINAYHQKVLAELLPYLDDEGADWLQLRCRAIQ